MHSQVKPPALDLLCLGELLIDFVATATGPLRDAPGFIKAAGGAPANVAVAAARLGLKAGFIGAVGKDEFGEYLAGVLRENGVDVRALRLVAGKSTPLAFVSLKENAERDFLFYWDNTADHCMKPRDIPLSFVRAARVFHFGSISLIHPSTRKATLHALRAALDSKRTFISCDPNLRLNLWPSSSLARKTMLKAIESAHLVKINEEELRFLTGSSDVFRGMRTLARCTGAAILVTMGHQGAAFRWDKVEGEASGFSVAAVDSTGAGDGFVAGFLSQLLQVAEDLHKLKPERKALTTWVRYANAVGALTTTKRGAIPAFPTPSEVAALLKTSNVTR